MKRALASRLVAVALALSAPAHADDFSSAEPDPPSTYKSNEPLPYLRLSLDAVRRPIFDVASSGGELGVGVLPGHGIASLLVDLRVSAGATAAGIHTWGVAGGLGVELAFEPVRFDLEGIARCLVYAPVSDVSASHACGVGARPTLVVDVLRFGEGGALFAEASIEADYFGDALTSVSPAAGIGARF